MALELFATLASRPTGMIPERDSILEEFNVEERNYKPDKGNKYTLVNLFLGW